VSEAAATEEAKPVKPKSKKMVIIIALVLLLVGVGVGGYLFIAKKNAHAAEDADAEADDAPAATAHAEPKTPPTFLPLDNMVVNLADPGGERMAQVGVTIELSDAHAVEKVKAYLPAIRSSILLLISQRTAAELLAREGKEKLAQDILQEVSRPLGFEVEPKEASVQHKADGTKKKKKKPKEGEEANPVHGVLFSSFIVQ